MRRLVAETRLHPADLVLPLFVKEGLDRARAAGVHARAGAAHRGVAAWRRSRGRARRGAGRRHAVRHPHGQRDAAGSQADAEDGILQRALRTSRKVLDEVPAGAPTPVLMADTCLDEFTDHGHCGVLDGQVL